MKYTLAIAVVLAVVAAVCHSSIIRAEPRANLNVGYISAGDVRHYSNYFNRYPGAANTVQSQEVIWRGNTYNMITAVRANEVGPSQNATAQIVGGGIGYNNVTVRFTSAVGRGFYYFFEIYGR